VEWLAAGQHSADDVEGSMEGPASAEPGARRRARLLWLGGAVAVATAFVIVLVATSPGKRSVAGGEDRSGAVATVDSTIGGIPQSANTLGSPSAPVTLVYFGDLECPYCREFTLGALPTIIRQWVRPGDLRIVYRSMKTATKSPEVFRTQQVAALAAGRQNKMWYFLELFYHEQREEDSGYVTEQYLHGLARQVPGLNLAQWTSDRNDPALAAQVASDVALTKRLRLPGTPSLFFGRSGGAGTKYNPPSLTDPKGFDGVIEKLLAI
jgi:protein-disulfide isomerase